MGPMNLLLGAAVAWLLIALVPLRSDAARRTWSLCVLGISGVFVLVAGLFASQAEVSPGYRGEPPTLLAMLVVAIAVAPGAIVALVRRGRVGQH
ncbi:hypothetical protein GTW61_19430 [Streptomyces sp. SID4921]|nr:hypothetical protein [Streptomyces sp. SID4921]